MDASKFPDEVALMLLGSSCSDEPSALRLTLYDPNSRSSNDVRETTCDDRDFEANQPEQSSLLDRDSSSACQVVTINLRKTAPNYPNITKAPVKGAVR